VLETLTLLSREGKLVDLKRESMDHNALRGFVATVSTDFVVVSVVDDQCHFNGATVLRTEDVTFVRWGSDVLAAWTRVLQESPTAPGSVKYVDLSSWETVVRSVAASERVVTFHREVVDDSVCYIGTNVSVEGECVTADVISVEGTINGRFALRTGDLTKLDFGGGYEQSLWRMVRSTGNAR
jgi:predicted RNA-binding protein